MKVTQAINTTAHAPSEKLDIFANGLSDTPYLDAAHDVWIHFEQQIAYTLSARLAKRIDVTKEIRSKIGGTHHGVVDERECLDVCKSHEKHNLNTAEIMIQLRMHRLFE